MLDTYTLVHTDGDLYIYDPKGNPEGTRQLWMYCNFQLPNNLVAPLLLSVLQFLEPVDPRETEGFKVSQIQNCFKVQNNIRYLFGYIINLQDQIGALESTIGTYPPTGSTTHCPRVYRLGILFFTKYGKWVHISRNKHLIEAASIGELRKSDMPNTVKSFSSAGEWKHRVSSYITEHK
jgi:hypothetical protein